MLSKKKMQKRTFLAKSVQFLDTWFLRCFLRRKFTPLKGKFFLP